MQKGNVYFEIQADDVERALGFYKKVFGWEFSPMPDLPIPYWRIITGGAFGGLMKRVSETPQPSCGTNAFVCSFEVESFDTTVEAIKSLGAGIALEKFAVPGLCWQGYFVDLEGNTFGIFEVDQNAR